MKQVLVEVEDFSLTHGLSPSGFSGLVADGCSGDVVGGGDLDQDDGKRDENICAVVQFRKTLDNLTSDLVGSQMSHPSQ